MRESRRPVRRFRFPSWRIGLAALVLAAAAASPALAQDPAAPPPVVNREQMWPAPTAEDWKKPCLITFQRTWADAEKVAKETGKAILICVNMDGEIASEHYAGVRYRQPDIAVLYQPYVCVIASTYRHTPSDYDAEGRRILCPRFGSVTCGEHIWIEPPLYEKYFDGKRIAPRHLMIELDGKETYDVYYRNDTASVFEDIKKGVAERATPVPVVRGDRSIIERVDSSDIEDRKAVEAAYLAGDAATRKSLLDASLAQGGAASVDLLRLAVFGLDVEASRQARKSLAQSDSTAATDLIAEALRVPMDDAERDALIAALARIGKTSPRAEWLAVVHQGLAGRTTALDVKGWMEARGTGAAAPLEAEAGWTELESKLAGSSGTYRASPEDAAASIEVAEASLALAMKAPTDFANDPKTARVFTRQLLADARASALRAEKLDSKDWRVNGIIALADYYSGDVEAAYPRAELAVKALPPGDAGWNSMAVLTVFAESRWKAIKKAVRAKEKWPPQWLTDVNATYSVLMRHPRGTDDQVVWHLDFLTWLGAFDQMSRVIDDGIARFPSSSALHQRLRTKALRQKGPDGLEAAYEALLREKPGAPGLEWFAGYASSVAAEFHRRARNPEKASAAYDHAIGYFDRTVAANPGDRASADRQAALAIAGRARIAFEAGDDEKALTELLASFERDPTAAATFDGLSFTPASTAHVLLARLKEKKRDELLARLEAALSKLDPALLALPKGM